ncbi:MAG: adenine-specific methyltransferase EcoRI family protein [Bacteroidales bacterium]|nr:adenine-specific methyltransferase EcoRI family protein [Bacteroidales bacterium]
MANKNLNAAKIGKQDEFYTRLEDINEELRNYREHFRGKTVLCNCDDPRVSNFFTYFAYNFEFLGLKRLITTCYKSQSMDLFSQNECEQAIYLIYDGDHNGNNIPDAEEIGIHPLKGDGDFRSQECIELLKQADIVVTNPPFSLFREYVAQLIEYEKKFLIIGNKNLITKKEIFPLFMNNKMWVGCTPMSRDLLFEWPTELVEEALSDGRQGSKYRIVDGKVLGRSPSIWYTNLDNRKRHEELILYKHYTPEEYPQYANYNAIEVNKTELIPCDYDGLMGVPITFMDKYNPIQFEIIGASLVLGCNKPKDLPKSKQGGPAFYLIKNGEYKRLYDRIVIRKK